MNLKHTLYLAIIFVFSFLLISCKKNRESRYLIKNNTNSQLFCTMDLIPAQDEVNLKLIPGTTTIAIKNIDQAQKEEIKISDQFSTLRILTMSGQETTKNTFLDDNWQTCVRKVKNKSGHYEHEYVFEINESDF